MEIQNEDVTMCRRTIRPVRETRVSPLAKLDEKVYRETRRPADHFILNEQIAMVSADAHWILYSVWLNVLDRNWQRDDR